MSGAAQTIAVLGAGQMGAGIAHTAAVHGLTVLLYDHQAAAVMAAMESIAASLSRQVKKENMSEAQAAQAQALIRPQHALGAWLRQADFIIEAVSERQAVKEQLYAEMTPHIADDAVLASNTSSYSITALAESAPDAARFVGLHFMNPVPLMPLAEVIAGAATAAATVQRAENLAQALGKQTVVAKDTPGFIANRILFPMLNEAAFALHDGVGGVEDIDRAMTLGMNHPMGPLTLADFIGLDTCLAILNTLHDGFRSEKYRPCPLFEKLTAVGCLGRKSGSGFYDYRGGAPRPAALFAARQDD